VIPPPSEALLALDARWSASATPSASASVRNTETSDVPSLDGRTVSFMDVRITPEVLGEIPEHWRSRPASRARWKGAGQDIVGWLPVLHLRCGPRACLSHRLGDSRCARTRPPRTAPLAAAGDPPRFSREASTACAHAERFRVRSVRTLVSVSGRPVTRGTFPDTGAARRCRTCASQNRALCRDELQWLLRLRVQRRALLLVCTESARVGSSRVAPGNDRGALPGKDRSVAPEAPDGAVDAEEQLPQELRDGHDGLQ
jgi:hypothetical protein